jgi:hypothetical protein
VSGPGDGLPTPEQAVALLSAILHSDNSSIADQVDLLDLVLMVGSCYSGEAREHILASWEICPVHECDEQICADDQVTECARYRS